MSLRPIECGERVESAAMSAGSRGPRAKARKSASLGLAEDAFDHGASKIEGS